MTDSAGGKDVRIFQAQNAFLLKLIQTDADEIRKLRAYIEYLQRRNFASGASLLKSSSESTDCSGSTFRFSVVLCMTVYFIRSLPRLSL